jgi:hypothetical protein
MCTGIRSGNLSRVRYHGVFYFILIIFYQASSLLIRILNKLLANGLCTSTLSVVPQHSRHSNVPCGQFCDTRYSWGADNYVWEETSVRIDVIVVFCVSNVRSRVLQTHTISQAVRAKSISEGVIGDDAYVVVAGPANTYSHSIATLEEYGVQRYEGASTIYGQCEYGYLSIFWKEVIQIYEDTLNAYIDKYTSLVSYLADSATGTPVSDAPPPEQTSFAISLQVNSSPTRSIRGSN